MFSEMDCPVIISSFSDITDIIPLESCYQNNASWNSLF